MTAFLVLLTVGLAMTVAQGVLAVAIAPPLSPDLSLLVVIAAGLYWRGLNGGLLLAVILGFVADLMSGSLLGTHALVRLFVFIAAFLASRQLNLRGVAALFTFAFVVSLLELLLVVGLTNFFTGAHWPAGGWLAAGLMHAAVNGVFAPAVAAFIAMLLVRLGVETGTQQGLLFQRDGDPA